MSKRSSVYRIIFIIIIVAIIIYISNRATEAVSNAITIATAILGFIAILYQLNRDHNIKKAEFLYSLNESFNNDKLIMECYKNLKEYRNAVRNNETVNKEKFSKKDLNDTGNYIMFFVIMNYLINKGQISIKMVDKIFANKFFIFCHNEFIQSAQFQKEHIKINYPMMELYETWYNYRMINNLDLLYDDFDVLAKHEELYRPVKGLIQFKHTRRPKLKFYVNRLFGRINNDSSFR